MQSRSSRFIGVGCWIEHLAEEAKHQANGAQIPAGNCTVYSRCRSEYRQCFLHERPRMYQRAQGYLAPASVTLAEEACSATNVPSQRGYCCRSLLFSPQPTYLLGTGVFDCMQSYLCSACRAYQCLQRAARRLASRNVQVLRPFCKQPYLELVRPLLRPLLG